MTEKFEGIEVLFYPKWFLIITLKLSSFHFKKEQLTKMSNLFCKKEKISDVGFIKLNEKKQD